MGSPGGYWTGEGFGGDVVSRRRATLYVTYAGSPIGRRHEKGDLMAKAAAGAGSADSSVADQLRELGVKGVLVQMAERGQLLALKCEMPLCYHHEGRGEFDQVTTPRTKWAPLARPLPRPQVGRRAPPPRERSTCPRPLQKAGLWMAEADRDAARERQVPRRDRRGPEQEVCPPGPRYEPMDGRDGAQGLRVLGRP